MIEVPPHQLGVIHQGQPQMNYQPTSTMTTCELVSFCTTMFSDARADGLQHHLQLHVVHVVKKLLFLII